MTDERQRESRANLRSGLENAKEDLKRLREEAARQPIPLTASVPTLTQ